MVLSPSSNTTENYRNRSATTFFLNFQDKFQNGKVFNLNKVSKDIHKIKIYAEQTSKTLVKVTFRNCYTLAGFAAIHINSTYFPFVGNNS